MDANDIIRLMGILYFVLGISFILNKKHYLNLMKELPKSKTIMFFGGYIALVIGFILLFFSNTFTLTREGLVAVFGSIALIKGVALLLFPKSLIKITKLVYNKKNFGLISFSITILGILLIYLGFVA